MKNRLTSNTVKVDMPITCSLEQVQSDYRLNQTCRLEAVSLEAMSISLPIKPDLIKEPILDYDLNLPQPFTRLRGQGQIQSMAWDNTNQQTHCQVKLEPMTLPQLVDYDILLTELSKSN